jgi:hypothetical protein
VLAPVRRAFVALAVGFLDGWRLPVDEKRPVPNPRVSAEYCGAVKVVSAGLDQKEKCGVLRGQADKHVHEPSRHLLEPPSAVPFAVEIA